MSAKAELRKKIDDIVAEYGNDRSNIPYGHEYWDMVKQWADMKDVEETPIDEPTEKEKQDLDNEVLSDISGLFEKDK